MADEGEEQRNRQQAKSVEFGDMGKLKAAIRAPTDAEIAQRVAESSERPGGGSTDE